MNDTGAVIPYFTIQAIGDDPLEVTADINEWGSPAIEVTNVYDATPVLGMRFEDMGTFAAFVGRLHAAFVELDKEQEN